MIGSLLYSFQESMLFHPWELDQDFSYEFRHDFDELFLNSSDGAVINALHFKVERPKGVILYFHGNAGHLQRWGEITSYFVDLGYDLMLIDYRGFGKSTGPISEQALYDDGLLAYNYVLQRYAWEDIIVYGRSLGSSVATKVAGGQQVGRLILESPFYNLYDVARKRFPIFPVKKMLKYQLPNNEHLQLVDSPIHIFHGTDDYVVPFSSGRKLADSIRSEKLQFVPIEGGGHNNLDSFESYREAMEALLK